MLYAVSIEVDDRKAQVVAAPYQFAIAHVKRGKSLWLKVGSDIGVVRALQEWAKVHRWHGLVVKFNFERLVARLGCCHYVDGGIAHFNLLVMRSGDTALPVDDRWNRT